MSKTVLIADDEKNILISLEFLMKREGFTVVTCADGEEAERLINETLPDLVLLDVMMPNKTGYEICQNLRNQDNTRHIPVIMLSAKGRESDVTKGMAVGANDYIVKPFSTRDLVDKVHSLLGMAA